MTVAARRIRVSLVLLGLCVLILASAAFRGPDVRSPMLAARADTTPPLADAGPDQTVNQSQPVTFDGSASTDNVGIVNYTWTLPAYVGLPQTIFALSLGGYAAAFDPIRPYVYLLESTRVDAVNLSTGAIDQTFPIDHTPQYPMSLAISPGGAYLAVSIPTGPRGYYYFGPYDSFFASIDLATQTKLGEFFVPEDAYRVAVSDTGFVIISGGSGQWAGLHVYNARNGTALPQTGSIWQNNFLGMHPSNLRFYGGEESGLSTLTLYRYDFDPVLGITTAYGWPYWGSDPGGRVFLSPDGRLAITGSGMVLALNDNVSLDMSYVYRLTQGSVTLAAFDPAHSLIAIAEGSYLFFFDSNTFDSLGSRDLGLWPMALAIRGNEAYAFDGNRLVSVTVPRLHLYGATASYAFADAGTFTTTLTVWDAAGNSASDTMSVTVLDSTPPVADAGPDQSVYPGTLVTLAGWNSTDNVGIVNYTWTFDDSGPVVLYGLTVFHRFDTLGTYQITLTARDAAGNEGSGATTVFVVPDSTPPLAVVNVAPSLSVYKGTTVQFDGYSSYDNVGIVNYTWHLYDGGSWTLYGISVYHRFDTVGDFPVSLVVRDAAGNLGNASVTLTVIRDTSPPVAVMTISPSQNIWVNETVVFNGIFSYDNFGVTSYVWTFDDGGPKTLQGPIVNYSFQLPGVHAVTLTVSDAEGNTGGQTSTLNVQAILLTEYHHRTGFSIGVLTDWSVSLDYAVPNVGTVDLVALGPVVNAFRVNLFVISQNATVTESTAFLQSEAQALFSEIRTEYVSVVLVKEPSVIPVRGTYAAVFEVYVPSEHMSQIYAVAVSASRGREYVIVGSADADAFADYRPLFEASLRSFSIAPLIIVPVSTMVLEAGGITAAGAVIAALAALGLASRFRARPRADPVSQAQAVFPTAAVTAPAVAAPRFCPRCGAGLIAPFLFCTRCGQPLR